MSKNHYKENYKKYLEKGMRIAPDKYGGKGWALSGISDMFHAEKLSECDMEETAHALEEKGSNISLILGKPSGVIALDLDTDKPEIMGKIEGLLPHSPVEKKGSKGFTRFFRYTGEHTDVLKYNGEVILELLSSGKKTTLPPSRHPNGSDYVWTSEKTLLDVSLNDLPVFPPYLVAELSRILGGSESAEYGKVVQGRNQELSQYLGDLLNETQPVDTVIKKLIEHDKQKNDPPYLTDPNEHRCTDASTNALSFYSSHMVSINSKRFRDNKEYLSPVIPSMSSEELALAKESAGKKSQRQGGLKKLKVSELLPAPSVLKNTYETLIANSWVPQEELAFGSVLTLFSTLASRKFVFQGMSPNLYICNISKSGTGKNAGMEFLKNTFIDIRQDRLLGPSDVPSDAGLMDALCLKPTMVLPLDEVSGVLQTANSGGADYNRKLGDLLCELYTLGHGRFLGRGLVEDSSKGAVDRPNLNILGATTPRGFSESVNRKAIQKGLLGRFLLFFGDPDIPSKRVNKTTKLRTNTLNQLYWLASYKPEETDMVIQGRSQCFTELKATAAGNKRLDEVFKEFDAIRLANLDDTYGPIAARLYQQMIKLSMIHALANSDQEVPKIDLEDVEFGRNLILHFFENFKIAIKGLIFDSPIEKDKAEVTNIIREYGLISRLQLIRETPSFSKKKRETLIEELLDGEQIYITQTKVEEGASVVHYGILDE